jgi:hypothetical protein
MCFVKSLMRGLKHFNCLILRSVGAPPPAKIIWKISVWDSRFNVRPLKRWQFIPVSGRVRLMRSLLVFLLVAASGNAIAGMPVVSLSDMAAQSKA